jgi:hypothetical protein
MFCSQRYTSVGCMTWLSWRYQAYSRRNEIGAAYGGRRMGRKTRPRLVILTVVLACGITSVMSMAASLTPYANDSGSKDSKVGVQRCLGQTQQVKGLHAPRSEYCVERHDAGSEAHQPGSVDALLRHLGIYESLSGFSCSPGLDCGVKSTGGLEPLLQGGSLPVTRGTISFRDDQTVALWSPAGGRTVFELNGGDNFKPLLDDTRFVPVSAPVAAQPLAPAHTIWDRILHFSPFLLLFLESLREHI